MKIKNLCFPVLCVVLLLVMQKAMTQSHIKDDDFPEIQLPLLSNDSAQLLRDSLPQSSQDSVSSLSTDTIAEDSIKSNAIDAPIQYTAKDSMVMTLEEGNNMLYLYSEASIKYKNMDLGGEYIEMDADKSIIFATFGVDTVGNEIGYPVFKEGESQYEMKKVRYNFKTKKMFVWDVITQQGDGYVTASETKKTPDDVLYMCDGKYTTCDEHEHPHFYLHMTRAKVRPGKNIVMGPTYLVIEDVPLPLAIPFGFFPFTNSNYASGIIMPTYGDELSRGFSLRNGGYYFAFNDYMDLALTGEIYTKGSWGIAGRSSYRKRYKFSGNLDSDYIVTILGDKESPDYYKKNDFSINWSHSQDAKANPFHTFSAGVRFSTSSYNHNSMNTNYTNQYSENTKSSNITYSYRPPNSPFSFSANASITQNARDTSLSVSFPNLSATMRDIYPFKRKEQIGAPRWYEKIMIRYNGSLMNNVTSKEYNFFEKNILRDWRNGIKHDIPVSASFNLFKYITVTPSVNYTERWYSSRTERGYNYITEKETRDTIYGFNRVYDYNGSVSASTKLYGMYKPWGIFGNTMKKVQIRHVFTPSVSYTGAPDFSEKKYGFYKNLIYYNHRTEKNDTIIYSPYESYQFGVPGRGKSGNISFSIENNLEMKVPIGSTDSLRKISLIDNLRMGMSYNMLADSLNWSDLNVNLRLKFTKLLNFNINAIFDTYTYNENGRKINVPRWEVGKGVGRLKSTSWSFSYTLNNSTFQNLFGKQEKDESAPDKSSPNVETSDPEKLDENPENKPRSLRKAKAKGENMDADGYFMTNIAWSLNFNFSLNLGYDNSNFNKVTREYPYRITKALDLSGNISPTKNWAMNFGSSYDFELSRFSNLYLTVSRQMHCWSMSASIRPIGPMQSYSFSIAVNSSMLKDLKYNQSGNSRDAMQWGEQ